MSYIRQQNGAERRVDLRNLNKALCALKRGSHVSVGPGMTKTVIGGKVSLRVNPPRAAGWEPFEPRIQEKSNRVVRVATGRVLLNAYIFTGSAFSSGHADTTLSSTSGDYWISLKIGTAAATYGTVELDASTTAPEDRGWALWDQYRLIPLALATVSGSRIQSMQRLHYGGDVTVFEEYPGSLKMFTGSGYVQDNKGEYTGFIDLPPGWRPADGTDSVPDMTGRVAIMLDLADGTTPLDAPGETGGALTHAHGVNETIPKNHSHGSTEVQSGTGATVMAYHDECETRPDNADYCSDPTPTATHWTMTTNNASSLPPFIATLFIVKI